MRILITAPFEYGLRDRMELLKNEFVNDSFNGVLYSVKRKIFVFPDINIFFLRSNESEKMIGQHFDVVCTNNLDVHDYFSIRGATLYEGIPEIVTLVKNHIEKLKMNNSGEELGK